MITLPGLVATENAKAEVYPCRLFEIGGTPTLYYTDADKDVILGAQVYTARGVSYSRVKAQLGFEVDTYTISIDNLDDALIAWALANDPTFKKSSARRAYLTGAVNGSNQLTVVGDSAILLFTGLNTSCKADIEFTVSVKSNLDLQQQRAPKSMQDVTCRFRGKYGFKGVNCGYAGAETTCNYTLTRCQELGNTLRFGGFPFLDDTARR